MRKRICDVLLVRDGEQRDIQRKVSRARAIRDARWKDAMQQDRERRLGARLERKLPAIVELELETTLSAHADEQTGFKRNRMRRVELLAPGNDGERDVEVLAN